MVELTFQKIDVRGQTIDAPMTVKYAPAELTFAKGAQYAEVAIPGLELPVLQFVRGEATTLSMDLFFDSTEGGTGASAQSVTAEVEKFHKLVSIKGDLHHPPLVQVTWGDDFPGASFGESEPGRADLHRRGSLGLAPLHAVQRRRQAAAGRSSRSRSSSSRPSRSR